MRSITKVIVERVKKPCLIRIAPIFILLLSFVSTAHSQSQSITPDEIREVNKIARRFSERFMQTKDIRPIIPELFVSDFIERSLKTEYSEWLFLDPTFARTLSKRELRETYILLTNWQYLSPLYTFSRHSSVSKTEIPEKEILPKEVNDLLLQNETLRIFVEPDKDYSEREEEEWMVDTQSELRSVNSTLLKALPALRRAVAQSRAGKTMAWKETMDDFGTRFSYYKPWVKQCDTDCYGFPKDTQFFGVNAVLFQLELIRIRGKMRIVSCWFYFD